MKQKIIIAVTTILAIVCLVGVFTFSSSAETTSGYYTYTVSFGEATITEVDTSIGGEVIIPSELGGYPVTGISSYAFEKCSEITSITIPEDLTFIGHSAFLECSSLEVVNFNARKCTLRGVEREYPVFRNCPNLKKVNIGNSVTTIPDYAFWGYSSLRNVTISDGVTSIGIYAFGGCSGLSSVTIPNSVTSIGDYAFSGCSSLSSVTICDGVTSIGELAFEDCNSLTSVIVPNSVTSIGEGTFYRCDKLVNMTLPFVGSSRTAEGTYYSVFGFIFGLGEGPSGDVTQQYYNTANYSNNYYYIPSTLKHVTVTDATNIPYGAFYNCDMLTSISISNSVTSIGKKAFYNCEGITSVTIPNSVTSISEDTFCYCKGLTSVILPDSVTNIGESAFYGCYKLSTVWYGAGKPRRAQIYSGTSNDCLEAATWHYALCEEVHDYNQNQGLSCGICGVSKKPDIPVIESQSSNSVILVVTDGCEYSKDGITWQSSNVFDNLLTNTTYTFYQRVQESETSFVSEISEGVSVTLQPDIVDTGTCGLYGDNITWQLDTEGTLTFTGEGEMAEYTWTNFVPTTPWYQHRKNIKKIIVEDGVTSVGKSAFYRLDYTTSIEMSNDVVALGAYSLAWCSNITELQLPNNLQYIGNYCFEDCTELTNIFVPDSVTTLGACAFSGCTKLSDVRLSSNITILDRALFLECESLETLQIPSKVTEIGYRTFYGCSRLEQLTIPNTVTTIGNCAFEKCTGLKKLELSNAMEQIPYGLCMGCTNLETVEIPSSVAEIGSSAFSDCTNLETIEIPFSVVRIDEFAFSNCISLINVALHEGLEEIEKSAFYKCMKLETLLMPKSVTSIGQNAYGFYTNSQQQTAIISGAKILCYANTEAENYAKKYNIPYLTISIDVNSATCEYTGEEVIPDITVTIDNVTLEKDIDFVVTYKNNVDIGTATANLSFINDYDLINGVVEIDYRIGNLLQKCEISLDREEYQYHTPTPDVTIKSDEKTLMIGVDYVIYYTLSGETWENRAGNYRYLWEVGECAVKIVGINSYIGEETVLVNVSKFDMANAKLWTRWVANSSTSFDMQNFQYDGTEKTQSGFRVCDPNDTIASTNYIITYKDNVNVGTATMIITGHGDYYTGTLEKNFEIYPGAAPVGDCNNDGVVTDADALYLLYHTIFGDSYPIGQYCDYNKDGSVTDADALYLLYHTIFGDSYPLN